MRERAKVVGASLEVWSSLDSGVEVQLTLPSSAAYEVSDALRRFRFLRIANSESSQNIAASIINSTMTDAEFR
jgi:hypothetical protein